MACGTLQADYRTGGENVLTCHPCSGCGRTDDVFETLELIALVGGVEIDLKETFLTLVTGEIGNAR